MITKLPRINLTSAQATKIITALSKVPANILDYVMVRDLAAIVSDYAEGVEYSKAKENLVNLTDIEVDTLFFRVLKEKNFRTKQKERLGEQL